MSADNAHPENGPPAEEGDSLRDNRVRQDQASPPGRDDTLERLEEARQRLQAHTEEMDRIVEDAKRREGR